MQSQPRASASELVVYKSVADVCGLGLSHTDSDLA